MRSPVLRKKNYVCRPFQSCIFIYLYTNVHRIPNNGNMFVLLNIKHANGELECDNHVLIQLTCGEQEGETKWMVSMLRIDRMENGPNILYYNIVCVSIIASPGLCVYQDLFNNKLATSVHIGQIVHISQLPYSSYLVHPSKA